MNSIEMRELVTKLRLVADLYGHELDVVSGTIHQVKKQVDLRVLRAEYDPGTSRSIYYRLLQ